jgi:hypothetical protein
LRRRKPLAVACLHTRLHISEMTIRIHLEPSAFPPVAALRCG